MARAKQGGTSAKLRGVVGDVIYQIVRNPYGSYDQKIITYTKDKLNANTRYQCLARMQIALMQYAMQDLTPIVSSSFEGIRDTVTSVNEFVSANMKMIQDYCVTNWKEANGFCYPLKGTNGGSWAPFIISYGSYQVPQFFSWRKGTGFAPWPIYSFQLQSSTPRLYDLRKILGFSKDDVINFVYYCGTYQNWRSWVLLVSLKFSKAFNDYSTITTANAGQVFDVSYKLWNKNTTQPDRVTLNAIFDPVRRVFSIQPTLETLGLSQWIARDCMMHSWIFSKRKGNKWLRNTNRFWPPVDDESWIDWGRPPYEAYQSWDDNYDDEDYDDYFIKKL